MTDTATIDSAEGRPDDSDKLPIGLILALLIAAFTDGEITLWEAALFIVLYAVYIFVLFNWSAFAPQEADGPFEIVGEEIDVQRERPGLYYRITAQVSRVIGFFMGDPEKSFWRAFAVSIIFIAALSYFLVEYAVIFAKALQVPPVIVALTILAAGTSVPDLFASVDVARQGRGEPGLKVEPTRPAGDPCEGNGEHDRGDIDKDRRLPGHRSRNDWK